ncbi:transferrin receptor 1b [Parambassis ranga]|uniref:Transferrin receptor protein 1-like n=1 Tax=Parambassis ranga TaxID=210632 RepID=A0A6P7KHD8_9TELE|nr:transferrin receptor protein 1-like [Parambassis ranga]XP_028289084.1 transferrin receptor protein 1-like [Parambassis ranga]
MDRIRSAFNGMLNTERYSRFTLQPAETGEPQADVKLSDDNVIELEAGGSPSFRPAPLHQSRRGTVCLALGALTIFLIGIFFGYISHPKPQENCETEFVTPVPVVQEPLVQLEQTLDWKNITKLLTEKLTSKAFEKTLSDFNLPSRSAGSAEDMKLGNQVFDEFKQLKMSPWTDIHYVQLQMPNSQRPNRVQFGSDVFKPQGYLAYSASGSVEGKLVYGNYGRPEDLDAVQKENVELTGSVLLLRAGKISFAEQVDHAASRGASAVLIYPDPQDFKYQNDTVLYGHVHLGSGDPYTPGFPSFNHTQFSPIPSSGLPKIPAQTITGNMASALLQKIGGPESNANTGFKGKLTSVSYNLGGEKNVTVEVNNTLVNREIHNVFGVIRGFDDPDRYVVLGAQRDAWGAGYARATVGTSVLVELAKAVHQMVTKDGFRPRRSLVFASWSAGEYGSVGATEWLEGYMASIDKRAFTYISLDGVVMGCGGFKASASPLLYSLLENTMKEVKFPLEAVTLYDKMKNTKVLTPMSSDDPAYPFLAFSGIPSISFHFTSPNAEDYPYYGTNLDDMDHLDNQANQHTSKITAAAAQFAGQMALRLVHDHLLSLDVSRYKSALSKAVYLTKNQFSKVKDVSPTWLYKARGSFQRAADSITDAISNTDLNDKEACRILNGRIMTTEHSLLSPYLSPINTPFRHLLFGRGPHTLASIATTTDVKQLHTQVALATWTLQGCANAMQGDIWDIDNTF